MKRLFGFLALAGLLGGAVVTLRPTSEAQIPPIDPIPLLKLECIGYAGIDSTGCCFGNGPRQLSYRVKFPGGNHNLSVSQVDIGTHWSDPAAYGNLLMPAGWSMQILPAPTLFPDRLACTSHGDFTSIGTECEYILRWSGPAQTSSFTLGYDAVGPFTFDIHDVHWKIAGGPRADWSKPVGLGRGPVHSIAFP
jgi:hypothetical protein